MKTIVSILFLFSCQVFLGQNLEFVGGVNRNAFFDYGNESVQFSSEYESKYGYTIGIGINDLKIDETNLRFTLSFDSYCGNLDVRDGGKVGSYSTSASVKKSIISLGIFPINFKIRKKIDFSFGFEISRLLIENVTGVIKEYSFANLNSYLIEDKFNRYNSLGYFGLRARVGYNLDLTTRFALVPQYSFYYGIGNEFVEFPNSTKSLRNYFCIGVNMKIGKE